MHEQDTVLLIGDVRVRADGAVLQTLLGSCVAICLCDVAASIGGMNHFGLPGEPRTAASPPATRFGGPALLALLDALAVAGARRATLRAKLFGGARLLTIGAHGDIGAENIAFARAALANLGIPIAAADVGGTQARRLLYRPDTGRALVTRLGDEKRFTPDWNRAA